MEKLQLYYMLKTILEKAGKKGWLSWNNCKLYRKMKKLNTERTTPESLELQKLFREMVDKGVNIV